jgi:uncharacterized protein YndB with AHSA1/START domain
MAQQKTSAIRQRVTILASPLAVYRALTNARQHAAFTQARATGVARNGARFTAWDGYISGRHIELTPAQRIVQEWETRDWPSGYAPSLLDIKLQTSRGGTLLSMVHTNVPARRADDLRAGWIEYWKPLKAWFNARAAHVKLRSS